MRLGEIRNFFDQILGRRSVVRIVRAGTIVSRGQADKVHAILLPSAIC
jgi:hypothetical protein